MTSAKDTAPGVERRAAGKSRRGIGRRGLLKAALIGVPAVVAGGGGAAGVLWAKADVNTVGQVRFRNRLAVPPLAPSRVDGDGRRVFQLRAAAGRTAFRGRATPTWGYNGGYLGPTLRAARGETVSVNVTNALPETTSVHWHGMHLPAAMDGGPHQPIRPGGTWAPSWTIDQAAATLWYHPHPHGRTALHVYRGLAGLFLVDEPGAGLPDRYGVDDIPVIVQDRNLGPDHRFDEGQPLIGGLGLMGDTILVNGTYAPFLPVVTRQVRLRILNASNARTYRFVMSDGRPFMLVGTDGGLLPAPHETRHVQLSPGERAEIVVAMRAGERAVLRSRRPELGTDAWTSRFSGGDDAFDVLELRAAERLAASPDLPSTLAEAPGLVTHGGVDRTFVLSGYQINGKKMDMSRIDFGAARGVTEIWELYNQDGKPHNFHVHASRFQVVAVDGHAPPPELRGWKDTVYVKPNGKVRIAVRFDVAPDPATPFMFHCHLLYHEDQGMMGQFVVLGPGQRPAAATGRGDRGAHHH